MLFFKPKLKKAFDSLEDTMIRNIANTLIQLRLHQTGTAEELQKYYGWEEPFEEIEREKLIDDTLKRLEAEQWILNFYQKNNKHIRYIYGNKNPAGNLGLTTQRSARSNPQHGGEHTNVEENGSGKDTGDGKENGGDVGRYGHAAKGPGNSDQHDGGGSTGQDDDRPGNEHSQAPRVQGYDRGGEEVNVGDEVEVLHLDCMHDTYIVQAVEPGGLSVKNSKGEHGSQGAPINAIVAFENVRKLKKS